MAELNKELNTGSSEELGRKPKAEEAACPFCDPEGMMVSGRTKERTDKEFNSLMNRLKRIEGQIRGVQGMLEKGAYCPDILIQVSAINSALNSFNKELLSSHIRSCVKHDIQSGDDEAIEEFVKLMQRLMK